MSDVKMDLLPEWEYNRLESIDDMNSTYFKLSGGRSVGWESIKSLSLRQYRESLRADSNVQATFYVLEYGRSDRLYRVGPEMVLRFADLCKTGQVVIHGDELDS